jgi:probable phosphoglycerate mutase
MKIIIVRHGDPDYEHDSLTEKGWREAAYLGELLADQELTHVYVSPLGRARDTAATALKGRGIEPAVCDWLQEFEARIHRPDVTDKKMITWDWLPRDWAEEPVFYDHKDWLTHPVMTESNVKAAYDWVVGSFDALLASHGYERQGHLYRAVRPNRDTIVFFCHFGVECVLLSRLLDISPMVLWHHMCAAPSSFTTLVTEERREGIALFRMTGFGETAHLRPHDEPVSPQARFCETWDAPDERHD